MPIFIYEAIDSEGREIAGEVEAEDIIPAIGKIRELGYYTINIARQSGLTLKVRAAKKILPSPSFSFKRKISAGQIALFTRKLEVLLRAGLPLVRSLYILSEQTQFVNRKEMILGLVKGIEEGGTFSETLSCYPEDFSRVYTNMVKAGERSGAMETILGRLATFMEKNIRLANRISTALIYPLLVMAIAFGIMIFMITFVIPKFVEMFADMGTALPVLTQLLINVATFLRQRWYLVVIFFCGIWYTYISLRTLARFRLYTDALMLKLPVFGSLLQKVYVSRIFRTLATLLNGGVPILQALLITRDVCNNRVISGALEKVHDSIKEGESIAQPLELTGVFPSLAINMIKVGEESGSLDAMLERVADAYDNEVDDTVTALTSILEPMLIIIMGVVVLVIVVALFLPLITLMRSLSG